MIIFGITFSDFDILLFSCCGALIIAFIQLRFTAEMSKRDRFNAAAKEFTKVVMDELIGFYPTPTEWSDPVGMVSILEQKFPRLEQAVTEFRCHLCLLNRIRFDKAWHKYQNDYYKYLPYTGGYYRNGKLVISHDTTTTYKKTFKENVDRLLKYAKYK